MDIQEIINNKVAEMLESGVLKEKIENAIASAVDNAIESQFSRYGNMQKQLEEQLEEGLKFDFSKVNFDEYNAVMLSGVKQKINQYFVADASSKFMRDLDEMLSPAPKEMDVNDLINQIITFWREDSSIDDNYATVECVNDGFKVYIGSSSYRADKSVHLYIRDGEIRISHDMKFNPTALFHEDALIFRLYAAGTKIIGEYDEDLIDTSLGEDYDY